MSRSLLFTGAANEDTTPHGQTDECEGPTPSEMTFTFTRQKAISGATKANKRKDNHALRLSNTPRYFRYTQGVFQHRSEVFSNLQQLGVTQPRAQAEGAVSNIALIYFIDSHIVLLLSSYFIT